MNANGKIVCPTVTVWVVFILNFFFHYYKYIAILSIKPIDRSNSITDIFSGFNGFLFFSLLINCLIHLAASILVTMSFEKKIQRFYTIGLIMTVVFDVYMTVYFIIYCTKNYNSPKIKLKGIFIFDTIFQILMQWSQFGILMLYLNKVKSSFSNSYLNSGLVSDSSN